MECIQCGRKGTKYRCIQCSHPVCNVCTTTCTENTPGYCEETYSNGKCGGCSIEQCSVERKRKLEEASSDNLQPSTQSTISSFFKRSNKVSLMKKPENVASTSKVMNNDCNLKTMGKGRTLKVLTAENWKQTSLAKYDGQKWLVINADKSSNIHNAGECGIRE